MSRTRHHMVEGEIDEIFDLLRLETEEDRKEVLESGAFSGVDDDEDQVAPLITLSNCSDPLVDQTEVPDAQLDGGPGGGTEDPKRP